MGYDGVILSQFKAGESTCECRVVLAVLACFVVGCDGKCGRADRHRASCGIGEVIVCSSHSADGEAVGSDITVWRLQPLYRLRRLGLRRSHLSSLKPVKALVNVGLFLAYSRVSLLGVTVSVPVNG